MSLELKFNEDLLLISMRWGAASTPRIRGCAPWGQATPRGLGQKSSTGAPQLLRAFPGDCKVFFIALPFFLPACEHVQINQWSLKCSFMNIMFHYSFHLFWAEQASTKKDIFEDDWKHLIYLFIYFLAFWFSKSSTYKLDVVCTWSCRFPYITEVSCCSLFHNV